MPEDDYRVIAARQFSSWVTSWAAGRVRSSHPRQVDVRDLPEAERPAIAAAEKMLAGAPLDPGEAPADLIEEPFSVPPDLFAHVYDRDEAKFSLMAALRAKAPVHILLEGDPASGKSDLLECVARLPHARYAVGGMMTTSGLVEYLLERPSTRIVVIDELEKARREDYAALYSLMQSGRVPRLIHGKIEEVYRRVWVFAACNDSAPLPEALKSRFVIVKCRPYSSAELRDVNRIIASREGHGQARATEIAERVAARSSDPRVARDVARMASDPSVDLDELLDHVSPKRAENE